MLLKVGYLDYILVEGDKLYKLLGFQGYLNVEELPRQVKIFERTVNLEILEENLHDSVAVYGDSFLTDVFDISILTRTTEIAVELQMVNQAFQFL